MPIPTETLWPIEEHTKAKHEILKRYLGAWFAILGSKIPRIVYIDGFCGPGQYAGGESGSPIIALDQAKAHPNLLKTTEIVFLFIDNRKDRMEHLDGLIKKMAIPSNFKVYLRTGEFENQIHEIFADMGSSNQYLAPTFAFIDPFGWSGLPFDLVQRLLNNPHSEVFVTVMVDSINRFVEHPNPKNRYTIRELFGVDEARIAEALNSGKGMPALTQLYQDQLKKYARFVRYFEMRNRDNRIIYNLFFAGNHPLGHLRMKEAFWKVDPESGYHFSDKTDPNQLVLFESDPTHTLADLLKRYFNNTIQYSHTIIQFVEDETAYITTHARKALTYLEANGLITVDSIKADGKRRTHGFPTGTVIHF